MRVDRQRLTFDIVHMLNNLKPRLKIEIENCLQTKQAVTHFFLEMKMHIQENVCSLRKYLKLKMT